MASVEGSTPLPLAVDGAEVAFQIGLPECFAANELPSPPSALHKSLAACCVFTTRA
jgi:hypothetical protein